MIPDNSGSVVESKRLAENPPDTPANAAASPAIGCLPNDKNITLKELIQHILRQKLYLT